MEEDPYLNKQKTIELERAKPDFIASPVFDLRLICWNVHKIQTLTVGLSSLSVAQM